MPAWALWKSRSTARLMQRTFRGSAFYYDWNGAPGSHTVCSRVQDTLGFWGAATCQPIVVASGPTVAGTACTLANPEVWTPADHDPALGAILLVGDVTIPNGCTVQIQPGTQVQAAFLTDATFGNQDVSRIEVIANGVLQVDGSNGSKVSFDSKRGSGCGDACSWDWHGIRFGSTTTDELSRLQYCKVDHGLIGVEVVDAAPNVTHCDLRLQLQRGFEGDERYRDQARMEPQLQRHHRQCERKRR
jgi:hypothetical protein